MKKILAIVLSVLLMAGLLYGCGSDSNGDDATGDVKTGLAVITDIGSSKDAGEDDGLVQANSVIVALTVDNDGKITDCAIDTAQTKVNFTADGQIVQPLDTVFKSKQELGDDYGMVRGSDIGKEWFEQANALAEYVVGKTVSEVKGISMDDEGYPTESDLTSSVTMHITDYIAGIEKAVANAEDLGASAGDDVAIGVITTIDKSKHATDDEEGLIQIYSTYSATTFDSDGVITSCVLDASQSNVNFTNDGKITTDLSVAPKTKNELGEDYGMKRVSSIGKEWDEQAEAFAQYAVGKTAAEVSATSLDDEGYPAESDLTSSVTMHVGPFMTIIEKAYDSVK